MMLYIGRKHDCKCVKKGSKSRTMDIEKEDYEDCNEGKNVYFEDGFEWNIKKNEMNLKKRGICFEEAKICFYDEKQFEYDDRRFSEQRHVLYGHDRIGRLLFVVYTWRGENRRIISVRKTQKHEERNYERSL